MQIRRLRMSALMTVMCVCALLLSGICSAMSPEQVTMLQLFYNSTGGPNWIHNSGWSEAPSTWVNPCNATHPSPSLYGVTCGAGSIQSFDLQSNNLVGTIPAGFFLLFPTITNLVLLGNAGLTGQIPDFAPFAPLSIIILSECGFTGTIPPSIFTPALQQLQLELNQLTGGLPDTVGNSTQLNALNIGQNRLSIGAVPDAINNCASLVTLSLISSGVTSLPSTLSFGGLTMLNLQGNNIGGSLPQAWCNLAFLKSLYLQDNHQLSGTLPDCIRSWTSLQYLVIENTQMSGTIPEFLFQSFPNLLGLYLSGSKFSGTIPDLFDNLPLLQHAEFNGNNVKGDPQYSGPFPLSLLRRSSLQTLSIQYTSVEGFTSTLSGLPQLSVLTLASNPMMEITFPTSILTETWLSPSTNGANSRGLLLQNIPMSGTVPIVYGTLYDLSQSGGFGFSQTLLTGYIPNSTLSWVPASTQRGLFANCPKLLAPVKSWMLPLTNNFGGLKFQLSGAFGGISLFSMAGGETLGIVAVGSYVNLTSVFQCGFCIGDTTICTGGSDGDLNGYSPDVIRANVLLTAGTLGYSSAAPTNNNPDVLFCQTPTVPTNAALSVYVYYTGPGYGLGTTETYMVSANSISVGFYNPRPTVFNVIPDHGRLEGCTALFVNGSGFSNAPNMTLRVADTIWASGTVINDTFVKFLLPGANSSRVSEKYNLWENYAYTVDAFANGNVLSIAADSFATYTFVTTCDTPLVVCSGSFTDDEGCPTPLCRCFSEGFCRIPNGTTSYQCDCQNGFGGSGCSQCNAGFYGVQCQSCSCDHGTCSDGLQGDGSCDCESNYFGKSCNINKYGLGIGVPVSAIIAIFGGLLIRKRLQRRGTCMKNQDSYGQALNEYR